ncbi:cytochrome c [Oscillatoria amoena NRMC-F 0135]|nr:cytochrome c [Oscillatoria amoena NRMC-F 0135]
MGDLDAALSVKGKGIYELKCQSCHRLEGERLVGPSFKGVTERRTPEWVMNMVMNTEAMLNEDADAKSLLELCLVRMPNQNVAEPDARAIVEYLRDIDGHKKTWTE